MTHLPAATSTTGATSLGDRGASFLRTAIPSLWGTVVASVLAWALPLLPGDVGEALSTLLASDVVVALLVTASIAIWYALARWIEPRIPDWLTRLVLGSAAAPMYVKVAHAGTTPGSTPVEAVPDGSIRSHALTYDSADEFTVPGDPQPRS